MFQMAGQRSQRLDKGNEAPAAFFVKPKEGVAGAPCFAIMPLNRLADAGRPAIM